MFRKKAQPKEWGDIGPQLPIEEVSPDEWEARHLTRQKMVGWILPYNFYPTIDSFLLNRKFGMVEVVSSEVGKCPLSSGVCSEYFTAAQRQQFVREEVLNMYRDNHGKLVMLM